MTESGDFDPQQWEQQALQEIRGMLSRVSDTSRAVELDQIALDGSFPDTRVVLSYVSGGTTTTERYRLWGPEFKGPDGRRIPAGNVATLIYSWISERLD